MNPIFELDTQRLIICLLSDVDADFILELLNEPAFKRYIGDRNVKNQDDARSYLVNGPFNSYKQNGFGL